MELTKRLAAIASYVKKGSIIADVGTDHGYIPIYLAMEGVIKKAYAMDINQGPLDKARKHIEAYRVQDKVETILSDGLKGLGNRSIDTIIIAGMGGMLISQILQEAMPIMEQVKRLILSPHLDEEIVRRTVHGIGFSICEEDFLEDDMKFYPIIVCEQGHEIYERSIDYKYGKQLINSRTPVYRRYLQKQVAQVETILNHLGHQTLTTLSQVQRIEQLNVELNEMQEVLKCLSV